MAIAVDATGEYVFDEEALLVPEELRPAEYGRHITAPLPLGNLIRLNQIRLGDNPEVESLRESIDQTGLINLVDVAVLQKEPLETYIDFVNRLWGCERSINEFEPDEDGNYYLVIAGHSRVEAITRNEENRTKRAKAAGFDTDYREAIVYCKLHPAQTPESILQIQMAENIYKEPAEERRAIAIVEMYRYGEEIGRWQSVSEFTRQVEQKFTQNTVQRALLFQQLPDKVRNLVVQGRYKYGVAIELAKLRSRYIAYTSEFYFDNNPDLTEAHRAEIEEEADMKITTRMEDSIKGKWTIKRTAGVVRGQIEEWERALKDKRGQEDNVLIMADPTQDWQIIRRRTRRNFNDAVRQITDRQIEAGATAVALHRDLSDDPEQRQAVEAQVAGQINHIQQRLGEAVLGEAAIAIGVVEVSPKIGEPVLL